MADKTTVSLRMTDQPPVDLAGVRAQAAVLRSSMRDTAAMLGAAADEIERLRASRSMPADQTTMERDLVDRLRETLTSEDTDEAMWRRIARERQEAADAILALRVKLHRERSKRGHAIAARHYSGTESDRQNGR